MRVHTHTHIYIMLLGHVMDPTVSVSVTTYCVLVFRDYGIITSLALSHGTLSMLQKYTEHHFEHCKWLTDCPCQNYEGRESRDRIEI